MVSRILLLLAGVAAMVGGARAHVLARRLEHAEHAACTDPLTGLANRVGLQRQFDRMVSSASGDEHTGLLMLDLDSFKRINDTLGHDAGDRVLAIVGRRLARFVTQSESVLAARLGGDEFVVLFRSATRCVSSSVLWQMTHQTATAIGAPIQFGADTVSPQVSAGFAYVLASQADLGQLMANADAGMYRAKKARSGLSSTFDLIDRPQVCASRPRVRVRDLRHGDIGQVRREGEACV